MNVNINLAELKDLFENRCKIMKRKLFKEAILDSSIDKNVHETACASIIKKQFSDIDIFSVKILNSNGIT